MTRRAREEKCKYGAAWQCRGKPGAGPAFRGTLLFAGMLLLASRAPAQLADPVAAYLDRGRQLTLVYCQSCHLYPDPDVLDKKTWANGTMRRMAPLFGTARIDLDRRPDGMILKEAHLFPPEPILPIADWKAMWDYILDAAPEQALPQGPRGPIQPDTPMFEVQVLSDPAVAPAVTLVKIESKRRRLLLGDGEKRAVHEFDSGGHRLSSTQVASPPVSWARDGDKAYVSLIGSIFPSDEKSGEIVVFRPGEKGWSVDPLIRGLKRPVDCVPVDLNRDGRPELVVAQFGNYLGRLSWFEMQAGAEPVEHPLLELPGGTCSEIIDYNHDGRPDVVTLMGQAREGIFLFENMGGGDFATVPLVQLPPVYGSTYFEFADFNGDGFPDLLAVNGDNGEYPSPFKKYHGIRIYLNDGRFHFKEAWFFPMNGAFKAVARDFDGDGDLDIAAISFFPDYGRSPEEGFVYLENRGNLQFTASSIPSAASGRWLTMDAADLDGDGDIDLVLGSFIAGPRSIPIPAELEKAWAGNKVAALILRNRRVRK